MNRKRLIISNKKDWLKDFSYLNFNYFLVLYKKNEILFNKTLVVLQKPKNTKKNFNLHYSNLCNIIKYIFKVAKNWFLGLKIVLKLLR